MSTAFAAPTVPEGGLRDRVLALRDRLVGSERFRSLAARFPPTRRLSRARAGALFDLCAGFVYAQVLTACVRLRLFDLLAERPQTAAALAPRLGLTPDAALRLLRAAESLRLVDRRGGDRWGLGALGAALPGNAGVAAMVEHHAVLYADLADPVALLRGERRGALGDYWGYAGRDGAALPDSAVAPYSRLMALSQPMVAAEVLAAYPFARHRRLLDLGGGEGAFLQAVAAHAPALDLTLFDLPAVATRAESRLHGRARCVGGDLFRDALPDGHDLITLVRVLHDHDDAPAAAILRVARAALASGGTLLVAEPMAETPGAAPAGAAYFGFYLLAMGSGRPRSAAELTTMLHAAGFAGVRERPTRTPLLARVLVARA